MAVVSMSYLLEAGVHFGHQKRRWNPKMGEYIYTSRDDIYIIDLQKTSKMLDEAYEAIANLQKLGKKVVVLSGDTKASVESVCKRLNITEYHYGLLPQDKVSLAEDIIMNS